MNPRPRYRLVDNDLADAFRDGRDEERRLLNGATGTRADVLERMRKWETELHFLAMRRERLHGRLSAGNDWLTQHSDGEAS